MANVLVITTKGGSGKSTISQQVVAPWLYQRSGERVQLIEIDPMNYDCLSLSESSILTPTPIEPESVQERLPELLFSASSSVIDVGGNVTAANSLDFLSKSGVLEAIDLVLLPVSIGVQDALNAKELFSSLSGVVSVIVVLNLAKDPEKPKPQFPFIFGYAGIEPVFEKTPPYVVVPLTEMVNYSKNFGQTIAELAFKDAESLRKDLKEALKRKDSEAAKELVERIYIIERAKDFVRYLEKRVWPKFEDALKEE